MDLVKKFFPVSTRANDILGLIISIVIYLIVPVALSVIGTLLGKLPLIGEILGTIFSIIGWAAGIYCVVGIVLAVLVFLKMLK